MLVTLTRTDRQLRSTTLGAALLCVMMSTAAAAQGRTHARGSAPPPAYRNQDLPFDVRVRDLVGRMTLDEKVSQMMNVAPAIPRLGIPSYDWWNEALHGVARSGLATVFPQAIGLAATWDDSLIFRMASVISDEARAKHHE
jgi:beta-glucosidase